MTFLSDSTDSVAPGARTRNSRSSPSPPRNFPAPPESTRSASRSTRSGQRSSIASTGWIEDKSPSAKLRTALLPSAPVQAPVPPAGNSTKGRRPAHAIVVMFDAPFISPIARSGTARPRAPITSPSKARRTSPIAPHAAGDRAFNMVPSGAITVSGRMAPALIGPCGSRKALVIVNTAVVADRQLELQGQRLRQVAGVIEMRLAAIASVGKGGDGGAHPPLRAVEQCRHRFFQRRGAAPRGDRVQLRLGEQAGALHRAQIALAIGGLAHIGEDEVEDLGDAAP